MRYLAILLVLNLIQGCSSWATAYTAYASASQPHIICKSECDIKLPADIDAPLENLVKGAVAIVGIGGLTHVADRMVDKIDTGAVVVDGATTITKTSTNNSHSEANVSEANVSEANVAETHVTENTHTEANVSEVATTTTETTTTTSTEEHNPVTTTTTEVTDSYNDESDRSVDSSFKDYSVTYPAAP